MFSDEQDEQITDIDQWLDEVTPFIWPLREDAPVTQWYGLTDYAATGYEYQERHGNEGRNPHWGLDIGAGEDTPIYATADGEMYYRSTGAKGNQIEIFHDGDLAGYKSEYNHLQGAAGELGENGRRSVKQGELIGYTGKTGSGEGAHLDFRIYSGGVPVNIDPWYRFEAQPGQGFLPPNSPFHEYGRPGETILRYPKALTVDAGLGTHFRTYEYEKGKTFADAGGQ